MKKSKIIAGALVACLAVGAGATTAACGEGDPNIYVTNATELVTAVEEAKGGDKIVLNANIDLEAGLQINKELIIDLNGKTLTAENDTAGNGIFCVVSGGKLTIDGNGTVNAASQANDYSMAVWATQGGEVIINGGIFTNLGAKTFEDNGITPNNNELIYASKGGKITINGGEFIGNYENQTHGTRYTLNQKDENPNTVEIEAGNIIVKGGKYHGYNPAESLSENPQANFVADGYTVTFDGLYYVVSGISE